MALKTGHLRTPDATWNDVGRRTFLGRGLGAIGSLALAHLCQQEASSAASNGVPHAEPAADAMICLFQHGGPSQMDLFDPKPELQRRDGQTYEGQLEVHFHNQQGNLLGSPFRFAPRGESGIELSEILPYTSDIVDEITLIRSLTTESVDHESALRLFHAGKFQAGYPTIGAWITYALGSINQNLPAYVVLGDPGGLPVDGVRNWTAGWLPARFQGTPFRSGASPVSNLSPPPGVSRDVQRGQLELLQKINEYHLEQYPGESELEARIANYEIAARMQDTVPEALDISQETATTRALYGLDDPATAEYGTRCLIARRLIERGVRFVQLFMSGQPWDTHSKNAETLRDLCLRTDRPSAALVRDLQQRGLLDRTIVMWGGEFGRLPISQGKDGRDHNRHANSIWLAGGGFRRGYVHGATDEIGYAAVDKVMTVHDLHATLLQALGLNHQHVTHPHDGRLGSLTDVAITNAHVIPELLRHST